jgi:hypothetical protein
MIFWIGDNALTGPIPKSLLISARISPSYHSTLLTCATNIHSFTWMIFLILVDGNALTGLIPSELGWLTNLDGLYLRKFFIIILFLLTCATNIHSFAWTIFFILDVNALTGPIPSELGLLPKLTELGLRKSFLSFYLFNLCYKYKLTCLDDLLDFR